MSSSLPKQCYDLTSIELVGVRYHHVDVLSPRISVIIDDMPSVFGCYNIYAFMKNRDQTPEGRLKYGIKDNLVRFSFGVEDFEDLKTDVLQALSTI